jgi:hypothetical protein
MKSGINADVEAAQARKKTEEEAYTASPKYGEMLKQPLGTLIKLPANFFSRKPAIPHRVKTVKRKPSRNRVLSK